MSKDSYVHTPMEGIESVHSQHKPTGRVITDGKMTGIDVPARNMGPDSIPEVTLDENAGLPAISK